MMKRILSALLAAALTSSLCACGAQALRAGEAARPAPAEADKPKYQVARAVYPRRAVRPLEEDYYSGKMDEDAWDAAMDAWRKAEAERPDLPDNLDSLSGFWKGAALEFLPQGEESGACSPVNIYMALAMLAEVTEGESRAQILRLLGADSLESLRDQANRIWGALYTDDGTTTTILGSSLWMNEDVMFKEAALQRLAEYYYASSYRGKMGSAEFNEELRRWLNEQTRGLLEEQAAGIATTPETILSLAATIYFKSPWTDQFSESATKDEVFHAAGGDQTVPFMHDSYRGTVYQGDGFTATEKAMQGGTMWLILPDEGTTPAELLRGGKAMDLILGDDVRSAYGQVVRSVPQFDVVSDLDLIAGLKTLGVTDVFGAGADFSPMTDSKEVAITQAKHAARVKINEEGCEAAAFTVMMMETTAALEDPLPVIYFTLDRPFLFVVENQGLPLFTGVVNGIG